MGSGIVGLQYRIVSFAQQFSFPHYDRSKWSSLVLEDGPESLFYGHPQIKFLPWHPGKLLNRQLSPNAIFLYL
jgi:hypothetical protein